MRKICLVFLTSESFDPVTAFAEAFKKLGYETEIIRVPNIWISSLSWNELKRLKDLLKKKSLREFLIFSPQSTELFLREPDFTLIYSAYRSWFNPKKMRVMPHLWTPIGPPKSFDNIKWTEKPPLRIGFMGRLHSGSRLTNLISRSPMNLKKWLLRGEYLRCPTAVATMNGLGLSIASICTFPRSETIKVIESYRGKYREAEFEIVERMGFYGSAQELSEYANHMERNTYIICPRGTENYSFRIYEALSRGRIPVILDTEIVLPKEIDWDRFSIKIPYESLNRMYEIILEDYKSRSGIEFVERQNETISAMSELRSMRWVMELAKDIARLIPKL